MIDREHAVAYNNSGVELYRSGAYEKALSHFRIALCFRFRSCSIQSPPNNDNEGRQSCALGMVAESNTFCDQKKETPDHQLWQNITLDMFPISIPCSQCDLRSDLKTFRDEPFEFSDVIPILSHNNGVICGCNQHCCDYRDSAITLYNRALTHHRMGHLDESLRMFSLALTLSSHKHHDASRSEIMNIVNAKILNNMGQIHFRVGNFPAAMASFAQALRHVDYLTTNPHEEVQLPRAFQHSIIMSLSGVSRTLYRQGDLKKAEDFATEYMRMCHVLYSESDIKLALSHYNTGIIQYERGRKHEALRQCTSFLRLAVSILEEDNLIVAEAQHTIGVMYGEVGNFSLAVEYLNRSLCARSKLYGREHHTVIETKCCLAKMYKKMGKYNKAIKLQRLVVPHLLQSQEFSCNVQVEILCDMGEIFHIKGQFKEAHKAYLDALLCLMSLEGDQTALMARLLTIIARIQIERGEVQDAIRKFEEASQIRNSADRQTSSMEGVLDELSFPGGAPAA